MSRRVLIVDDNAELAENLREILELEGFEVCVFTSPSDALAKKDELAFDAALLDIRMPDIDGIELCGHLAKSHPGATYVLMTAYTSEQRLADVRGSGVRAVLKKPLPIDQLLSLLGGLRAASVLLVEDDDALRGSLAELLAPHGYHVHATGTLADARATVANVRPDVAIIDVKLPDGSGAELARELMARDIAVVLTTGYDEPEVREAVTSLRARGARYLEKPFAPSALLDVLAHAAASGGSL
ncbi:MAG TPA: response regulator [Sandaracinaceae bacterium]